MTKKELRKKYKKLRATLSSDEITSITLQIANQLLKAPIWNKTYYHLFLSIVDLKEIDTDQILHVLFARNKEVVVSKSDFIKNTLSHFLLTENTKFVINSYGIPEPQNGLSVPEDNIDVVFVPLLAFDISGNRVGYGKGFYDDFLSKCKSDVLKVGLSFYEAEEQIEDVYLGDIPLDYCITPHKIYQFNES
ncbi:5-formyltetrahydrofolate cyclo-ligase [Wenyingzhuangia heitensis]|uniref:5-formyltetrahydrofolate cyclo-ligase n=1 Tax=Wenyingzhuangia heitensis TaxID=1487859 RepID=A0ABX0UB69_9FLAO|nr:5-formyltetrahydrofolate cyclo-ligase [Wenyingzhuangia heitensis]NIJ46063.1 5-formyltetrahydrofolate cyclo-ligase [Wenyingzhuangia heitensis]